jgi:hypothetical protein
MSFLAPLFFVGLAAIAIPVLVHLIQRERKRVIEFPSLMFIQKIPYQSVRRRRIRHWFLLLMRAAAIALIVAAFARPFLPQGAAAIAAAGGNRELVILLDQSASMGYADHFERAREAARTVINGMGASDKATLVLFSRSAEESMRATSDRGRLEAALGTAKLTASATRYGPALKLAESILAQSTLPRREVVLISDFQKSGWSGAEDIHFGDQIRLTPMSVASDKETNISVPSVTFNRATFSGQDRITVNAGVSNRSSEPATNVPVTLEIEGHEIETVRANIGANASTPVTFAQFTLADPTMRGSVKAGTDPLPADNTFHFVLSPERAVSVLVVDGGDRADASFYLTKALGIGNAPAFQVEVVPVGRVSPAMLDKRAVVILNDTMLPPGLAGGALKRFVEQGGGLLVVAGERTTWPASETDLMPAKIGAPVDRLSGRGGTLSIDYSHPAFEIFKAPRSGDFSAARVLRYRALDVAPTERVLARFDDGMAAAAERRVGNGRVIVFGTALDDSWNDLAIKPVYLPLVHQVTKYLARYEPSAAWQTVGQVVDISAALKSRADRVVVTPAAERITVHANEPGLLELSEQGVYEIRPAAASSSGRPDRIAVNLDPAESDLSVLDPPELVAAVTGRATGTLAQPIVAAEISREDAERQQGLWWYLLLGGLLLLTAEMIVSNHLSRRERFL